MLSFNNITLALGGRTLLRNFNCTIEAGEMVALKGDSGSGKTSLLKAILGFVPLQEGFITIGNTKLKPTTADTIRRSTAYVPQELHLPTEWVSEMIQLPFDLRANRANLFSKERLFAIFEQLGLEESLYQKRVSKISGGQRQRIMLAVSGMLGKKLILVDEPTSALDADSTQRVLAYFQQLTKDNVTLVAASHDEQFIAGCNRTITL